MRLLFSALTKLIIGFFLISLLLFIPAGTMLYFNAWLFIGLLFAPMTLLGCVLFFKAPSLLEKRLNRNEKENTQKLVVAISGILFLLSFTAAGLDFRFEISRVPLWLVALSSVVFLASYLLYAEVMRENAYLSRTVEVQKNQRVIDTGVYGVVRHPMYFATVFMFLSMPLILGSFLSLVFLLPYPFVIVARIKNEEDVLERELDGYAEYKKRVRYRLIPFVW
ncbi:MAG: isoprenylcysteine carboxylmethyltransferase family protein [Clostridia bacterium]|nr:isoprenylcysteine carboxylmethyltransferase family protein [Clostridia bacterium]